MTRAIRRIAPPVQRAAWLTLGILALGLGGLGVALPVLPTTPFVLLAAFAFGKSAPGLQQRLENSALFGPAIADWRVNGAIAPRFKLLAVAMMAGVFVLSLVLAVPLVVLAVQFVCMAAAAAFILSRPEAGCPRPWSDGLCLEACPAPGASAGHLPSPSDQGEFRNAAKRC